MAAAVRSRQVLPRVPAGTNQEQARLHNRRVVMDAIRQAGQLTRAELTRLTALSAQTVSNIIAELQREGMLLAHAPRAIPQGQPPIPFSLNPEGAFSIGIHVGCNELTSMLVDFTGQIRATRVDALEAATLAEVVPLVRQTADAFCADLESARVLGMGIALAAPGKDGREDGSGWSDRAGLAALEAETGLAVRVANAASAAATGERLYGAARNLGDFVYLFIGREVRAVLLLANRIYAGRWNAAGQIGHLVLVPNGRRCPCGQRGCLGCYLSETSLLEQLGIDARRCVDTATLDLAARGVQRFVDGAVPALRYATRMLESLLDPEGIVVGGTLPQGVLQTLVDRSLSRMQPADAEEPRGRVQLGRAGAECVALGAASTVMLAQFSSDQGNRA